jgi:ActR/RegA family two-component response regulator
MSCDPLAQSIEAAGHDVCGVYVSSRAVLAEQGALHADVALIDLRLSDGDTGAKVAAALQQAGVRVIILSGYTNASAALGAIPHTYAAKPVSDRFCNICWARVRQLSDSLPSAIGPTSKAE